MTYRDPSGPGPSFGEEPVRPEAPAASPRPPLQPFTVAFIAVCVAVNVFDMVGGEQLQRAGMLYGAYVSEGQWWRVLTTAVLHANLLHLAMNMLATFDLGGQLERAVGLWRIVLITVITALGASTFVLLFSYYNPTVGASGVISGFVGAMLPIATHEGRRILTSLVIQIAIISLLPFVSWQGHLGGFLFGLLCGVGLKYAPKKFAIPGLALLAFSIVAVFVAAQVGPNLSRLPAELSP